MSFSYKNIDNAYNLIQDQIIKTPLITNDFINKKLNSKIFFKLENLQKTGSFKFRGASYKISKLNNEQNKETLATQSKERHAKEKESLTEKIACVVCNIKISRSSKSKHEESKNHIDNLNGVVKKRL